MAGPDARPWVAHGPAPLQCSRGKQAGPGGTTLQGQTSMEGWPQAGGRTLCSPHPNGVWVLVALPVALAEGTGPALLSCGADGTGASC